jgi:hypothetical protein
VPEPKRSPAESLPWVPLATVITGLLASGWLLFQPLTSSRPIASSTGESKAMSIEDVDARLWQDPLEPLAAAGRFGTATTHESESAYDKRTHSIDELLKEFSDEATQKRLILAVMVNGSGYAEKIERRLRDRVAVESALERASYSPKDAEHLGYFTILWPRSASDCFRPHEERTTALWNYQDDENCTFRASLAWDWFKPSEKPTGALWDCQYDQDCTLLTVPFEVHERDPVNIKRQQQVNVKKRKEWDKILVLWLRQDFFDDKPLTRLAQLLSCFRNANAKPCDVRILGPDTSDSLLSIINEINDAKSMAPPYPAWEEVKKILNGVKMFAFRPAASDRILLRIPDDVSVEKGEVSRRIKEGCHGLEFYRTTTSDDVLLETVRDELGRRNIRLPSRDSPFPTARRSPTPDTIAIVSEQDTLFGRAYPATFSWLLCGSRVAPEHGECGKHIERLSYLRGIDGRTPIRQNPSAYASSGTVPSPTPGSSSYNTTRPRGARELPEGTDQSDYIRRLAKRIDSLDDLHRSLDSPWRGITAVGVLGSDVYDKLEILHALRSRLRPKVFFTTGLDARFYHPDELTATRNLVVVSAFGLRLHGFYQGSVPPFRDHNQTAAFASALCALEIMNPSQIANSTPRIFEVSTNGPIDLSVDEDRRSDLDELRELIASPDREPTNIHPGRPDLRNWWEKRIGWPLTALIVFSGGVAFACYSIWAGQDKQNSNKPESYEASVFAKSTAVVIALSLPLILMVLALFYYGGGQRVQGEPFNVFASASMWPTEAVRLLVIVLSIHFVVKSFALLKENAMNDIKSAFWLDYCDEKWPGLTKWLRSTYARVKQTFWVWKYRGSKPYINLLWKRYCLRDSPACRLGWTAVWSVLYGFVLLFLWLASREAILPVRGSLMLHLDRWINFVAMAASTFLTLFVAYATALDARFALLLNKGETIWPEPVRKRHQFNSAEGAGWTDFNGDYLDVLLIARRTRAVTHLIYYPFITISLLILCRLPQFDSFDWPPLLIAVFSFNVVLSCACVYLLRRVAETVRRSSLGRLRDQLREARANGPDVKREAIEATMEKVKKLDTGIFAPITRQPVVGALLLPFGSAGISALIQFFH